MLPRRRSSPPWRRRAGAMALASSMVLGAQDAPARLVPASIAAAEGDPAGSGTLANLNAPFTDGAGRLGFTFSLAGGGGGVWYDGAPRFLGSEAAPLVLSGGESTMGIGDSGQFVYSPSVDGDDAVWGEGGLIMRKGGDAPGFPAGTVTTFHSRPRMSDDGTAYWVAGFNASGGTASEGRALYRQRGAGPAELVRRSDELVAGLPISRPDGVTFDHHVSGDGSHEVQVLLLDEGASTREVVVLDGAVLARAGDPTGEGDSWRAFDDVSVNSEARALFSGNTDGAAESDEFIALDGLIGLREGALVDGLSLAASATVQALSLNELGQAVHLWRVAGGTEHLLFAADAADLAASVVLLSTGDELDVDGDGLADFLVADLTASGVIGPGLDLAEDGFVFVGAELEPPGGGTAHEAIVRLGLGVESPPRLYRSSVTELLPGWQDAVPLPLTPASNIDAGWPRPLAVPGVLEDLGVLRDGAPLVLYLLLDSSGGPVGDGLRLEKGPGPEDLRLSD